MRVPLTLGALATEPPSVSGTRPPCVVRRRPDCFTEATAGAAGYRTPRCSRRGALAVAAAREPLGVLTVERRAESPCSSKHQSAHLPAVTGPLRFRRSWLTSGSRNFMVNASPNACSRSLPISESVVSVARLPEQRPGESEVGYGSRTTTARPYTRRLRYTLAGTPSMPRPGSCDGAAKSRIQ